MAWVPERLRHRVRERAQGQCEYCQTQESIVIEMEVDHIVPLAREGETELDNLCLACVSCNGYKRDFVSAIDPVTGVESALYNPRLHEWNEHFRWDESRTTLEGVSAIGRATVARLQPNRPRTVRARRRWVEAGLHPPTEESTGLAHFGD